jgi:hypothetical protein
MDSPSFWGSLLEGAGLTVDRGRLTGRWLGFVGRGSLTVDR